MISVCRKFRFEAAHRLPNHPGLCQQVHGHSYKLEVEVAGPVNKNRAHPEWGMIIDFGELSDLVNDVVSKLDHQDLNQVMPNPTAENLVMWIVDQILAAIEVGTGVRLLRARLWETENSYAEWSR